MDAHLPQDVSLLVIDDDPSLREVLVEYLEGQGFPCQAARNGEGGLHALSQRPFDVVITDLRMPGISGLEVVRLARERRPECEVIVITGHATIQDGVEAMKCGAYDFILKPMELGHFEAVLARCVEWVRYKRTCAELHDVNKRLLDLSRMKSKFLAVTDHELRTPVTVLDGMLQLLLRKADTLPEEARQRLQELTDVSRRLVDLVRGIHDLASCRSQGLPISLDWCDPHDLAPGIRLDFQMARFHRQLEFSLCDEVPEGERLKADLHRLRQAVTELIQNAVKATRDGGRVEVLTGIDQSGEQRRFVVEVSDNGVGIPEKEKKRIFDAFYEVGDERRHHTSKHEFGGSGLGIGLPLALEIAKAHGGGIDVESSPGMGSTFTLWVPLA